LGEKAEAQAGPDDHFSLRQHNLPMMDSESFARRGGQPPNTSGPRGKGMRTNVSPHTFGSTSTAMISPVIGGKGGRRGEIGLCARLPLVLRLSCRQESGEHAFARAVIYVDRPFSHEQETILPRDPLPISSWSPSEIRSVDVAASNLFASWRKKKKTAPRFPFRPTTLRRG